MKLIKELNESNKFDYQAFKDKYTGKNNVTAKVKKIVASAYQEIFGILPTTVKVKNYRSVIGGDVMAYIPKELKEINKDKTKKFADLVNQKIKKEFPEEKSYGRETKIRGYERKVGPNLTTKHHHIELVFDSFPFI